MKITDTERLDYLQRHKPEIWPVWDCDSRVITRSPFLHFRLTTDDNLFAAKSIRAVIDKAIRAEKAGRK